MRWGRCAGVALAVLMFSVWGGLARGQSASLSVRDANTEVRLLSEASGVRPGQTVRLGLLLTADPHWHTYWKNPGDAGLPTKLAWTLPDGVTAGEIQWPTPIKFGEDLGVIGYGYEDSVLLPVDITVPEDFDGATLAVRVKADWLACEAVCIPGTATLSLTLPVVTDGDPEPSVFAQDFVAADAAMPRPTPDGFGQASRRGGKVLLSADFAALDAAEVPAWLQPEDPDTSFVFIPDEQATVAGLETQPTERSAETVTLALTPSRYAKGQLRHLKGLLVAEAGEQRQSFYIDVPVDGTSAGPVAGNADVEGTPSEAAADPEAGVSQGTGGEGPSAPASGLLAVLGAAVLGGMVLNLMPCVFPVLVLKITGFVQQAGHRRGEIAAHGVAFAVGVLVSFWVIAAAVIALQATGRELGWGFQLQSPVFVGLMALVLFAVGLNFAGVFDIGVGLMNAAGKGSTKLEGGTLWGTFGSGVLATALATPCSAPFMTTAVGYALSATPATTVLVLTALGLGMALPYLVLSLLPGWLKLLPKPGAWMETFKQLMAFPMFAVAAYLVWVFDRQAGGGLGLPALLAALVLAGLGLWALGRWGRPGVGGLGRGFAVVACVLLLGVSSWAVVLGSRVGAAGEQAGTTEAGELAWEPYSAAAIERHLAEGRPVFVDFTADWCATCKFNERLFIDTAAVRDAVERNDVALFKADWTLRDDAITEVLASYGVASVPLYVFRSPDPAVETVHFDSMFSSRKVVDAIERVAVPAARGEVGG